MKTVFWVACIMLLALPGHSGLAAETHSRGYSDSLAVYQQDLKEGLEYKRMLALEALSRKHRPDANGLILNVMLHDSSKAVRRTAQRKLEYLQDPRIMPSIVQALQDPERGVRLAAIDALARVRDPSAAGYLLSAVQAAPKDGELVLVAMESLRELVGWEEPAEGLELQLHPLLKHSDYQVRWTVLGILGILGRPASVQPLMAMWPTADAKARIRLADAFANIGRVEPAKLLAEDLDKGPDDVTIHCLYALAQIQSFSSLKKIQEILVKNRNNRVRMACLYALVEIPDAENSSAILKIMQDRDPTVLHWAGYALAQLRARQAIPALEQLLAHPAALVRATAATALGVLQDAGGRGKLLERIQDPKETAEVKIAAAKALMHWPDEQGSAAKVFWQELQRPKIEWETRLTLSLALGGCRSSENTTRLATWLQDTDFEKALSAALALGTMGDERARPLLLKALDHGYPSVRRYAVLGLEGLKSKPVLKALANVANDDQDPLVRILCASALCSAGVTDFRVLLWNALDNEQEDIRSEAVEALSRSADDLTLKQLRWYLRREPAVPVRQTIQRALREHRSET